MFPCVCWFFSCFCFVPLFAQQFSSWSSALCHGLVWGAIAYGFTLIALFEVMLRLGKQPAATWYAVAFLCYFVAFCALWFLAAQAVTLATKSCQVGWLVSSFAYWVWIQTGFFYCITGCLQGYGLALPFLPLMEQQPLLSLLPFVRWWGMILVLLCFQGAIAFKKWWQVGLGILFFGMSYGFAFWQKPKCEWSENIQIISGGFLATTPYERAHEVCEKLLKAEQHNPSAQLLVLPESAFPYPLNEHKYAIQMWSNNGDLYRKYLAIGIHYRCEQCGRLHNSVVLIHKGGMIHRYDKAWMLPFFEEKVRVGSQSPFLDGKEELKPACQQEQPCVILGVGNGVFRICSELLWDMPEQKTVITLVHDGHYCFAYFPSLFKRYAQMCALEKQSELVYCGWIQ